MERARAPRLAPPRFRRAQKALEVLQIAAKEKPGDAEVAFLIGWAYDDLNTPDSDKLAIQWLGKAVAAAPRSEAYKRLGYIQRESNPAASAAAFGAATRMAAEEEAKTGTEVPWLTEALYLLGSVEESRNNNAAAKAAWQRWLDRNPTKDPTLVDQIRRRIRTM